MNIRIERPSLNRSEKENIAIIDQWIADTADKLNMKLAEIDRFMEGVQNASTDQDIT